MVVRSAFGTLAAILVVGMTGHAKADEKVLRAMSSLISAAPPSQPLPGTVVNGSLVVENRSDKSSFVGVFAPGPGLCIVRLHSLRQSEKDWAESGTLSFDFTKIKQVRWLSDTDDRASAPSRPMDAPEVRTVAIDAETPWLCRDVVHLATANRRSNRAATRHGRLPCRRPQTGRLPPRPSSLSRSPASPRSGSAGSRRLSGLGLAVVMVNHRTRK
jgi:hypothetical protein